MWRWFKRGLMLCGLLYLPLLASIIFYESRMARQVNQLYQPFLDNVVAAVKAGEQQIRIAEVTPFEWKSLCYTGPYGSVSSFPDREKIVQQAVGDAGVKMLSRSGDDWSYMLFQMADGDYYLFDRVLRYIAERSGKRFYTINISRFGEENERFGCFTPDNAYLEIKR